jgi:gluconate kinase
MPPSLLSSQLADLEPPAPDEHAITVGIETPLNDKVDQLAAALSCGDGTPAR